MKLGAMKAQLPWALEEADLSFCLQGNYGWSAAEALAPLGTQALVADTVDKLVAHGGASRAAGRPCAVHEQRRLRRHPRQAAGRAEGQGRLMAADPSAVPARLPLVAPSRSRRSGCRPGWPSTAPTCTGGARSCRRRRAQAMALLREGTAGWPARELGRARQLARRLLCHRGGRGHRLAGGADEPGRRPGARPGRLCRRADAPSTRPSERFFFRAEYVDELRAMTPGAITRPERYFAIIAKGDEVLDWREMSGALPRRESAAARRQRPCARPTSTSTCPTS